MPAMLFDEDRFASYEEEAAHLATYLEGEVLVREQHNAERRWFINAYEDAKYFGIELSEAQQAYERANEEWEHHVLNQTL